jgi:hypothetical protein
MVVVAVQGAPGAYNSIGGPLKALRVVEYENHGFGVNQHAQKPFQK